jgi:hypothetical protein
MALWPHDTASNNAHKLKISMLGIILYIISLVIWCSN